MIKPVIHMNGTPAAELLRGYTDAFVAICDAVEAMRQAAPNGRDYYPLGDAAFNQAAEEHRARVDALERIKDELYQLAVHVDVAKAA